MEEPERFPALHSAQTEEVATRMKIKTKVKAGGITVSGAD